MKVLIVDDEALKLNDIKRAVESILLGCSVKTFTYACDVIEEMKKEKYDLVISDMHFRLRPGSDIDKDCGVILSRKIRKIDSNVPIIICSSEHRNIPEYLTKTTMVTYNPMSIEKKMEIELKNIGLI